MNSLKKLELAGVAAACFAIGVPGQASAISVRIDFADNVGFYDPDYPGGGEHGPYDWLENGARYSGFWLNQVGTPSGGSQIGHTHLTSDVYGAPTIGDYQHAWRNDFEGGYISLLNGGAFDVVSIDYRILWRGPEPGYEYPMKRLPWSFAKDDVHLLLATDLQSATVDFPSFESQFAAFDIDDGSVLDLGGGVFDPDRPAAGSESGTAFISGFDNITGFYLGNTAGRLIIDSILIDIRAAPVPEPGTGTLVLLGLTILVGRRRVSNGMDSSSP